MNDLIMLCTFSGLFVYVILLRMQLDRLQTQVKLLTIAVSVLQQTTKESK
jgi:hypothetical protein